MYYKDPDNTDASRWQLLVFASGEQLVGSSWTVDLDALFKVVAFGYKPKLPPGRSAPCRTFLINSLWMSRSRLCGRRAVSKKKKQHSHNQETFSANVSLTVRLLFVTEGWVFSAVMFIYLLFVIFRNFKNTTLFIQFNRKCLWNVRTIISSSST